jgi:hypothetical protein
MRSHPYSVVTQWRKTMGSSLGDLAQIKVVACEPSALKKTQPMRSGRLSEGTWWPTRIPATMARDRYLGTQKAGRTRRLRFNPLRGCSTPARLSPPGLARS